jgi:hypothetical protein
VESCDLGTYHSKLFYLFVQKSSSARDEDVSHENRVQCIALS